MGTNTTASGDYSTALGFFASTNNQEGSLVYGDWTGGPSNVFAATGRNQFLIRLTGGVGIGTNSPSEALTVAGTIESTSGGFKFPDGKVQASAAAVTGWEYVTEDFDLLGHDHRAVLVVCPEGKKVMGGGFNVPREVQVTASMPGSGHGPSIDSQQWYVHVYNPTDDTHTVTAYAVCVNGSAP